jgi:hypothetical protein
MAVSTPMPGLHDRSELVDFGDVCISLLAVDRLWTQAVEQRDADAPSLGRQMQAFIVDIRERTDRVSGLTSQYRDYLNLTWPDVMTQLKIPQEDIGAINDLIQKYGGLGAATTVILTSLDKELDEEALTLAGKISDFADRGISQGDLSRLKKLMIGVVVVSVLVIVALPVATVGIPAATVGAALVTSAVNLATLGGSVAGGGLFVPGL